MTQNITPFDDGEFQLAVELHDIDGFRVQAPGLARALGFRDAHRLMESIPTDEKGYTTACTPGGEQRIGYLTEAGFYRALGQRQPARISDPDLRGRVERFQAWVYRVVLPMIRKTGSYNEQPKIMTRDELLSRAVLEATTVIKELQPKADKFDRFLTADGDWSVSEAAGIIQRAGVIIGEQRLFDFLHEKRWTFRQKGKKWRAAQYAKERGWLAEKPQGEWTNPETGETHVRTPQTRVTPKGVDRLIEMLTEGRTA